jgi:hypothetical protein
MAIWPLDDQGVPLMSSSQELYNRLNEKLSDLSHMHMAVAKSVSSEREYCERANGANFLRFTCVVR